jgi:hypothetical protein
MKRKLLAMLLAVSLLANTAAAAERRLGDVDGDGFLSYYDVMQILMYLTHPEFSIISDCAEARAAAHIFSTPDEPLSFYDSMAIMRRIAGLGGEVGHGDDRRPNPLIELWDDDEMLPHDTPSGEMSIRATICTSRRRIFYTTENPIPAGSIFAFSFTHAVGVAGNINRAMHDPESFVFDTEVLCAWSTVPALNNTDGVRAERVFRAAVANDLSAGGTLAWQSFISQYRERQPVVHTVFPEDFTLHPDHEPNDVVWAYCKCYYNGGGGFGFGRVTDRHDEPHVEDAIAVLRFLVGLSSPIADCDNARMAANIIRPGRGNPSARDATEILRYIVGLPNRLDAFYAD